MNINKKYMFSFIVLLLTEIFIALYVHDNIIRPYVGDILVIILMYCFVRTVIDIKIKNLPVYIFLFAVLIEISQYFKVVNILHLQNSRFFSILLGTSYDMKDILCYLFAFIILVIWEKIEKK